MKRMVLIATLILLVQGMLEAQVIKLQEGFETSDTLHLPAGWNKYNEASFPVDSMENWTVRDTGLALPGLATATSKAHSGMKAIGVSWVVTGSGVADAWLITKKISNIQVGDSLKFWATGGTTSYGDSLQIWLSVDDSTPGTQIVYMQSLLWPMGSVYGTFSRYAIDLSLAAGLDIWIGFRYTGDFQSVFGFFVHLDDVVVDGPTGVNQIDSGIPEQFALAQNYPNPFNPTTTIQFSLARSAFTTLKVYDMLGQEVATLLAEELSTGTFNVTWDASGMPSGSYFYRLQSGNNVETRKLMLVK